MWLQLEEHELSSVHNNGCGHKFVDLFVLVLCSQIITKMMAAGNVCLALIMLPHKGCCLALTWFRRPRLQPHRCMSSTQALSACRTLDHCTKDPTWCHLTIH